MTGMSTFFSRMFSHEQADVVDEIIDGAARLWRSFRGRETIDQHCVTQPDGNCTGSGCMHGGHHPAPWWYRVLERVAPGRCREIPEAQNPDRIVLRQFAIVKRYVYLQQFASSEDPRFLHSHQWHRTIALGLWGGYVERRIAGRERIRRAPYCYAMDDSIVHHVQAPSRGHTSIFVGLWRDDDLKHYYGRPLVATEPGDRPETRCRRWEDHIKVMVKRI